EERRGRRHQLALLAADSRRPALSGTLRLPSGVRGEPGAPRVAAHRTAPGTSPPFPLSVLSRRPRAGLEGARGHVALRPPGGLPKREAAPVARAAGGPEGRAGAARSRAAGGGALLRRADRRRPPRPRHHARRRTVRRADRELRGSHGALEAGWAQRGGDGAGRADRPDTPRARPG